MTSDSPDHHCQQELRLADPDRWLTTLFAPDSRRPALVALYAFNSEIARARESVSQPMLGQIRLQWWREAWDGISAGQPRRHPVVMALHEHCGGLDRQDITALIDARERDMDDAPMRDRAALLGYASGTAVPLLRMALQILGTSADPALIHAAATAYALTGLLRSTRHLAAEGRVVLPSDVLARHGLDADAVRQRDCGLALNNAIAEVAAEAAGQLATIRDVRLSRAALPAFLPTRLAALHLDALARAGYDPVLAESRVMPLARPLALFWAMLRMRI